MAWQAFFPRRAGAASKRELQSNGGIRPLRSQRMQNPAQVSESCWPMPADPYKRSLPQMQRKRQTLNFTITFYKSKTLRTPGLQVCDAMAQCSKSSRYLQPDVRVGQQKRLARSEPQRQRERERERQRQRQRQSERKRLRVKKQENGVHLRRCLSCLPPSSPPRCFSLR